ncbi:MAG: eukaryotic-like serine/threonine-protein kinase [Verrucomicrobiota bacterium]|jgi:serine/threonine-protein kinase
MLNPGQIFRNRYEIVQLLGRGVWSYVYRARDIALERTVALKVFEDVTEPQLARIQREAVIYSQLAHQHIVRLFDVITQGRSVYFVLEYIDGQSLAERIRADPPTLKQILLWEADLFGVLAYLHSANVVHRDIKPSNILIRAADGGLRLTDFGTSKTINDDVDDTLTTMGSLVGTILYAAPEQIEGAPVTAAVDVYAAGTVLYEMLTGHLPFTGRQWRAFSADDISNIQLLRPTVPATLVNLLEQMTSADSWKRPSSAAASTILNRIIADTDLDALQDSGVEIISAVPSPLAPAGDLNQAGNLDPSITFFSNAPNAKPTGFFADQALRLDAYNQSVDFFRSHLDSDYKNLLTQAKLAFALWLGCAAVAFSVLVVGVVLLYQGSTTNGVITLAADTLVLFIQKIFKQREDYYREQANKKHTHLQMGNAWTLAVQSVDGISDPALREQKLGNLSDALVNAFGEKLFLSMKPGTDNDSRADRNA